MINTVRLGIVVVIFTLPASGQDAKILTRAVTFLKSVPPRANLARLETLLPKGTRLNMTFTTTWHPATWSIQLFSGPLNGQFAFVSTRKPAARKPGMPPPPPFGGPATLQPNDQMHYVEIFLSPPGKKYRKGTLTAETKRYVDALTKTLGKPAWRKNTGEDGGPDATGWVAEWNLPGGRRLKFVHGHALLNAGGERPLLRLTFPYSKVYKP